MAKQTMPHSGLYIQVGDDMKDLITECTVSEVQEWLKKQNYDAFTETIGFERELQIAPIRLGFIIGVCGMYNIQLSRNQAEFDKFLKSMSAP